MHNWKGNVGRLIYGELREMLYFYRFFEKWTLLKEWQATLWIFQIVVLSVFWSWLSALKLSYGMFSYDSAISRQSKYKLRRSIHFVEKTTTGSISKVNLIRIFQWISTYLSLKVVIMQLPTRLHVTALSWQPPSFQILIKLFESDSLTYKSWLLNPIPVMGFGNPIPNVSYWWIADLNGQSLGSAT